MRAIERGLTTADFETMTFGMIIDYITTYNNFNYDNEESQATQEDFDRF